MGPLGFMAPFLEGQAAKQVVMELLEMGPVLFWSPAATDPIILGPYSVPLSFGTPHYKPNLSGFALRFINYLLPALPLYVGVPRGPRL